MLFLLPVIPVATKALALTIAKTVGTIALSAGTVYATEYARSAAKNRASKKMQLICIAKSTKNAKLKKMLNGMPQARYNTTLQQPKKTSQNATFLKC